MSNQLENKNYSEEIDLGYLIQKMNQIFKSTIIVFLNIVNFYWRKKFIVLALIVVGLAYGFYKETNKGIINEAIVIPNFGSVDFLYKKVEEINRKIAIKDTVYLKEIFLENHKELLEIAIEPMSDLYSLTTRTPENAELYKTLLSNQNSEKLIENIFTSKFSSRYHLIKFETTSKAENLLNSLLSYLNSNQHFIDYKEVYNISLDERITESIAMKSQIDSLLLSYSQTNALPQQGVNISDNSNVFRLFDTKNSLSNSLLDYSRNKIDFMETIKLVSFFENNVTQEINKKRKEIVFPPFILFLLFSTPFFLIYLFRKMKKIVQIN